MVGGARERRLAKRRRVFWLTVARNVVLVAFVGSLCMAGYTKGRSDGIGQGLWLCGVR
jgi:hypothetical protein